MPAFWTITYTPSGRTEQFYGSRGNHYEFADGSRLDLESEPVWCSTCGALAEGESIPTLRELDQRLADLLDPTSTQYKLTVRGVLHELTGRGDAFLNEQVDICRRRRRWREDRVAKPKCIRCGTTEVLFFPDGREVPHPAAEGTIKVECTGMCSTSFNQWFFTPEGDRIRRDTRPAYLHYPELEGRRSAVLPRLLKYLFGRDARG